MRLLASVRTTVVAGVVAALGVGLALAGCGGQSAAARHAPGGDRAAPSRAQVARAAAPVPEGDWTTFDYDTARSGVGPPDTGITAQNLHELRTRTVAVPGTVDSSAVELHDVSVDGRVRDVAFMETTYGIAFALDVGTGQILWKYVPADVTKLIGSPQITAATPVVDPDRQYIYTTSPDGYVHKLSIAGRPIWSTRVLLDPATQKLPSSLNITGDSLIVVTNGYYGDAPPYQGHVVLVNLQTGRIVHVFNSLCSDRPELIDPSSCPVSDSGIWGRAGSVLEPNGDILVATGNAPFNGKDDWGDSVLELSPTLRLLHNWTPADQEQLNVGDLDLGSTEPALLPEVDGLRLAVQGGKQGYLDLLDLGRLDGTTGPAGPRTGGELQQLAAPGQTDVFTAPAVWSGDGRTLVFVADNAGTTAYALTASHRLAIAWQDTTPGTSPVVAGGLLYVFDQSAGTLVIRNPVSGRALDALTAAAGHWNSPIIIGGRIILPVGNDNAHLSTGEVFIYHLPGR